jgi:hypothetical protein
MHGSFLLIEVAELTAEQTSKHLLLLLLLFAVTP